MNTFFISTSSLTGEELQIYDINEGIHNFLRILSIVEYIVSGEKRGVNLHKNRKPIFGNEIF